MRGGCGDIENRGKMKTELISKREFAKRIGVNHSAVNRAVENGRISYSPGTALLDYRRALLSWYESADVNRMSVEALAKFTAGYKKAKLICAQ